MVTGFRMDERKDGMMDGITDGRINRHLDEGNIYDFSPPTSSNINKPVPCLQVARMSWTENSKEPHGSPLYILCFYFITSEGRRGTTDEFASLSSL